MRNSAMMQPTLHMSTAVEYFYKTHSCRAALKFHSEKVYKRIQSNLNSLYSQAVVPAIGTTTSRQSVCNALVESHILLQVQNRQSTKEQRITTRSIMKKKEYRHRTQCKGYASGIYFQNAFMTKQKVGCF